MEAISEIIMNFLNSPSVEIAVGVLSVVYGAVRIIGATSIGKKSLNKLTDKFNKTESYYKVICDKQRVIIEEKDKQISELKNDYEAKLNAVKDYSTEQIKGLKNAISYINNENVKNALDEVKTECDDVCINDEIERVKREEQAKYDDLLERIEVLEHGREETTNNNRVEEEIQ